MTTKDIQKMIENNQKQKAQFIAQGKQWKFNTPYQCVICNVKYSMEHAEIDIAIRITEEEFDIETFKFRLSDNGREYFEQFLHRATEYMEGDITTHSLLGCSFIAEIKMNGNYKNLNILEAIPNFPLDGDTENGKEYFY